MSLSSKRMIDCRKLSKSRWRCLGIDKSILDDWECNVPFCNHRFLNYCKHRLTSRAKVCKSRKSGFRNSHGYIALFSRIIAVENGASARRIRTPCYRIFILCSFTQLYSPHFISLITLRAMPCISILLGFNSRSSLV